MRCSATIAKKSEGGVGGAVDQLRLPSVALPAVLLLSEVGVSSAVTLVLYEGSEASDVVLGLAVLFLLVGYMVLQAVRVLRGRYTVERVDAADQSVLQYVLDPTHEVDATDERWVRRNFYFVDGRSWPQFGVAQVHSGTGIVVVNNNSNNGKSTLYKYNKLKMRYNAQLPQLQANKANSLHNSNNTMQMYNASIKCDLPLKNGQIN